MKRLFKLLCIILSVIFAVLIAVDLSWLVRGSLEMMPTDEQIEKGRIASAVILIPLVISEVLALALIFKKK